MKKINVTFSLPVEINELLDSLIGRKHKSAFVAATLNKALAEKLEALKKEYREAEKDTDRNETIKAWKQIDAEGWDE